MCRKGQPPIDRDQRARRRKPSLFASLAAAGNLGAAAIAAKFATAVLFAATAALANPALAQSLPRARGQAIAQKQCARCHAIDASGDSRMGLALPFRLLSKWYTIEVLA